MDEQFERVKRKIRQLRQLDRRYSVFGSIAHRHQFNPPLTIEEINRFESSNQVNLPVDYVAFLTQIGNGGMGPFYGLEPLQNVLFQDLDVKQSNHLLNPSKPFLHTEPWSLDFNPTVDPDENEEEYEKQLFDFEKLYYNEELTNGLIAICNYGCGASLNLVINGQEFGNIWTDDRAGYHGIYPSCELGNEGKIAFLDWYELWLDNSLRDVAITDAKQTATRVGRPWWKIW